MADNTWPPHPFDLAMDRYRELDAWWTGDTETLQDIYTGQAGVATHTVNGRLYRGGVVGNLSKWLWGQPVAEGEQRSKMHVPLAADLCGLSADLLFGEAPQVLFRKPDDAKVVEGERWRHPAQDRLDTIIASDEAHAELLMGGELAAALGGSYIAAAWDIEVADHVFPKVYAADCAIPTFRLGRLSGVKLWSEYRDGSTVWRLIEEHQRGRIDYTLYKGSDRALGKPVPVQDRPETAYLASLRSPVDEEVEPGEYTETIAIGTGSDRLAVTYMKNAAPVPDWRKQGDLAHVGRADLDGIQDLLDKADLIASSLIRDFENGEGRITVPESWLEQGARGEGSKFDLHRQVYVGIQALGGTGDSLKDQAVINQFAIRVQEHSEGFDWVKEQIASRLGYSPTHLGLKDSQGTRTATEVDADLSDSERTRDKKAMFAKPALAKWAQVALEIDKAVFGITTTPQTIDELPDVVFSPVAQADPEKIARTVVSWDMAGAASTKTKVTYLHQAEGWDEQDIDEEVALIEGAKPVIPDPARFTGNEDDPNGERPPVAPDGEDGEQ